MVMRCLIVDDSPVFLRAARALLEREGSAVITASTGDEAGRLLDEVDPDVVLIDIDLGQENGFNLAAQLCGRTGEGAAVPPIILISSHGVEDFEDLIMDSPARGFLSKSTLSATAIRSMMSEDR